MKKNNFTAFVALLLLVSCSTNSNQVLNNIDDKQDIKWRIYKAIYLLTKNNKKSYWYTNLFSIENCFDDNTFRENNEKVIVSNYLLLDLVFYTRKIQNDTITYLIDTKYKNKCVRPTKAISMPDRIIVCEETIVELKVGRGILNTSYYNDNDSIFISYLKNNHRNINPWLYKEAKRRGVFSK